MLQLKSLFMQLYGNVLKDGGYIIDPIGVLALRSLASTGVQDYTTRFFGRLKRKLVLLHVVQ